MSSRRLRVVLLVLFAAAMFAALAGRALMNRQGRVPTWLSLPWRAAPQRDATEIFRDERALAAYVRAYGAGATVARLNALVPQFGSCHDAAHKTGRIAYELSGAEAFRSCRAECHSGCYHGAMEAYFREHGTANLASDLRVLCSTDLNPFFSHQCLHGVGHGLMAWTDYELTDALDACNLLPRGQVSCWTGVFMENIVGGLADKDGHRTRFLSDDPHYPCNAVGEQYKSSCYFLQTSRMMQLFQGDFARIAATCGEAPPNHQPSCFESMGRDVGGVHRGNPAAAIAACGNAPRGASRTACLRGAAQDTFWDQSGQDAALAFCALLQGGEERTACYTTIFLRAPDVLAQNDLVPFCGKVYEPLRSECLRLTTPSP